MLVEGGVAREGQRKLEVGSLVAVCPVVDEVGDAFFCGRKLCGSFFRRCGGLIFWRRVRNGDVLVLSGVRPSVRNGVW